MRSVYNTHWKFEGSLQGKKVHIIHSTGVVIRKVLRLKEGVTKDTDLNFVNKFPQHTE